MSAANESAGVLEHLDVVGVVREECVQVVGVPVRDPLLDETVCEVWPSVSSAWRCEAC